MTIALLVPVAAKGRDDVSAVLDIDDFDRLGGRKLSLGSHGYAQMFDDRVTLVHRWVMGAKLRDGRIVDHISGDRLDDRKVNLRFVTAGESSANVRGRAASGYRGVYPARTGGKWQARAHYQGRMHRIGTFDTPEEAAMASHLWRLENLPGYTGRDFAPAPAAPPAARNVQGALFLA